MPATGLNRRTLLLTLLAPLARADEAGEVYDVFAELATSLSASDAAGFMRPFESSMSGYDELRRNVTALCSQSEVTSSVGVVDETGDKNAQAVELDWLLQVRTNDSTGGFVRRREIVKCRLERKGKRWKITSLEPIPFFAPIRPDQGR